MENKQLNSLRYSHIKIARIYKFNIKNTDKYEIHISQTSKHHSKAFKLLLHHRSAWVMCLIQRYPKCLLWPWSSLIKNYKRIWSGVMSFLAFLNLRKITKNQILRFFYSLSFASEALILHCIKDICTSGTAKIWISYLKVIENDLWERTPV